MKNFLLVWLAVGLSVSIISSSLIQEVTDKNVLSLERTTSNSRIVTVPNSGDKEKEHEEILLTIGQLDNLEEELPKFGEDVNIIIDDNNPEVSDIGPDANVFSFDNDVVPMRDEDFYYNDLINRDPNEAMDTAAGFIPVPIFRKKHKSPSRQKPYASRRYFRRPYAYRRYYYFYPYYGYYPSSLRYY